MAQWKTICQTDLPTSHSRKQFSSRSFGEFNVVDLVSQLDLLHRTVCCSNPLEQDLSGCRIIKRRVRGVWNSSDRTLL